MLATLPNLYCSNAMHSALHLRSPKFLSPSAHTQQQIIGLTQDGVLPLVLLLPFMSCPISWLRKLPRMCRSTAAMLRRLKEAQTDSLASCRATVGSVASASLSLSASSACNGAW